MLYSGSRKKQLLVSASPVLPLTPSTTDFEALGIESLLSKINEKVLDSAGKIQKEPGAIALVWMNSRKEPRSIEIKAMENEQIYVNDHVFAATKDEAKNAIIEALRHQVKN
jgi:hypothetical protein